MKILCLGDSYTVGEGIPQEDSWPYQLLHALRQRDVPIAAPEIIAKTGWTTADLLAALDAIETHPPYDLVTLMIGVNDQYDGRGIEAFTQDFKTLFDRSIALAGGRSERVFVFSIPDWSVTPHVQDKTPERSPEAIQQEIQAFNQVAAKHAYTHKVQYINVTEMSRDARRGELYRAPDGLHYSRKMYSHWVEHFFARMFGVLYPGFALHVPVIHQTPSSQNSTQDA